jgi:TRAP-type uncharacterized transport system fused permease subunit
VTLVSGIWILFTSVVGVALISVAAEGYLFTHVNIVVRVISGVTALLLINSNVMSDVVGLVLFAAIVLFQRIMAKRGAPPVAAA